MSTLQIKVSKIEKLIPHENSNNLEIAKVLGWETVIPKNQFKEGDLCVMIPYDTLLTKDSAEKLGVSKYLKGKDHNRVGHINLRGKKSYGIVTKPLDPSWKEGKEVAPFYGASKYEPPVHSDGKNSNIQRSDPRFPKYTDIENLKNFADVIKEEEIVYCSEKIHGISSRVSSVNKKILCGSRQLQRKRPGLSENGSGKKSKWYTRLYYYLKSFINNKIDIDLCKQNWWWFPYSIEGVRKFLEDYGKKYEVVGVYGETYGKVQFMEYDIKQTKENPSGLAFACYDIMIDGKYLSYKKFKDICDQYDIPRVPELYVGPFSLDKIKELAKGNTILGNGVHIREGLVVKPIEERLDNRFGRVVLKFINDDYLDQLKDQDNTDF